VRLSGTDYKLQRGGLEITYTPNSWQVARATIDLNEGAAPSPNLFTSESPIDVKIENNTMMTGYVVSAQRVCTPLTMENPGKNLTLELLIADKVGYLTKGEFANDYFRLKPIQKLIQDVAGTLGVTSSVSASLSNTFKRSFFGTRCTDALGLAVERGADWYGDEAGVLNAWPQSSPPSLTTGGLGYQIQDFKSGGSQQIEVSHIHKYWYSPDDALQRYRNVKVMNSNRETFPKDMNQVCSDLFFNGRLGYNYSKWISSIEIAGKTNLFRPAILEPGPPIGGGTSNNNAPAMSFTSADPNDKLMSTFWYVSSDDTSMLTAKYFGLPMNSFDQLWFHIWTNIDLTQASEIDLELQDHTTPGHLCIGGTLRATLTDHPCGHSFSTHCQL
jgi:hypothetical protein